MVSWARRQILRRTAAVGSILSISGCANRDLSEFPNTESVPEPYTNDEFNASYGNYGSWLVEDHDGGRTQRTDSPIPRGDVDVAWLRRPGTDPHGATPPIVGPNRVYIGYRESPEDSDSWEAYVAAFDAKTGDQRREIHLGTGRPVGLAHTGKTLLAVTRGPEYARATLTAISPDDGTIQWTETLPDVTGSPAIVDGACYLATRDEENAVYAYTLDGTRKWRTFLDGECFTATCGDRDTVYVGLKDGRVVALNATTGDRRWVERIVGSSIQGTPTVANGRLYVSGESDELISVDVATGTVVWRTSVEGVGSPKKSPAVTDETVYVGPAEDDLVALAVSDGSIRWRSSQDGSGKSPAVGGDGVVVPLYDSVVAHEETDTRLWSIDITVPDTGVRYSMETHVALAHGLCYVGIADGRVYAVGARE